MFFFSHADLAFPLAADFQFADDADLWFFLTQTRTTTGIDRVEAEEQSASVKVYSPAAGMIVVTALGGEKLDRVQVFTMHGKMVHSYQLPDKQRMILRVPSGIYIVKASTQPWAKSFCPLPFRYAPVTVGSGRVGQNLRKFSKDCIVEKAEGEVKALASLLYYSVISIIIWISVDKIIKIFKSEK